MSGHGAPVTHGASSLNVRRHVRIVTLAWGRQLGNVSVVKSDQDVTSGRADLGTRARVARMIGEDGPVTATVLAEGLGLTSAGVRRHLEAMFTEGLVEVFESRTTQRRPGRPAKAYVLTPRGHATLRSTYHDLAVSVLDFVEAELGGRGIEDFAQRRAADLERRYAPRVEAAGPDPSRRAEALAESLSRDGYAASTRTLEHEAAAGTTRAVQLCQGHCPVYRVAKAYPQLCDAEQEAFSRLLGMPVRRLATLAQGAHVCTTHVSLPPT